MERPSDTLPREWPDVPGRQASDVARRRTEERLRLALAASHTGTFRWDVRSGAFECDEHLERLFGLEPGSPRTVEAFRTRIHAADVQRLQEAWRRCASDGVELEEEFRVVWPDGSVHWLRDRGRRITQADGSLRYVAGACTDVTEHRRMEDELRAQEARFRTLANAIPQLAWMTDASGAITWYNQRWYDYTGTTLEEVQGWGWRKVHRPDLVERVVARIRHSFATGEPWEDTFPLRRRDGQYRWFLSRALPIRDRHDAIVGWFGTNTDITDRREADMERERLLVAERGARAEAERATRIRDELLGIVAHDLRNPVHTIVMSAATMREIPLRDDERARHLAIIERTAKGMNHLIADLLDVTRIESGSLAIHRTAVDVGALIDEMLELFAPQAQARQLALAGDVAPELPAVPGDRARLAQVLSNLIGNALKFTPPGGRVRLRASRLGGGVRMSVEDSGCGIAADSLPHVFDRFWQADRTSRAGAGLGLAIARGIVGAHGGTIGVESAVGVGSTFHCTLPAGDGEDPATAR